MSSQQEIFKSNLAEWVELKRQLKEIAADTKILKQREKELASAIKSSMGREEVDVINSSDLGVKVAHKISQRTKALSVKTMRTKISDFFEARGDPNTRDLLFVFLDEARDKVQSETLTMKAL